VINVSVNVLYPAVEANAVKNMAIGETSNNKRKWLCLTEGFDMLIGYTAL
jgi:hypothetical protein